MRIFPKKKAVLAIITTALLQFYWESAQIERIFKLHNLEHVEFNHYMVEEEVAMKVEYNKPTL